MALSLNKPKLDNLARQSIIKVWIAEHLSKKAA
jgi:hypothetical protein